MRELPEKPPPQNLDAERAVLGSILADPPRLDEVLPILPTEAAFYRDDHRRIYHGMRVLHRRGEPVDAVSISHAINRAGKTEETGGAAYLAELMNSVGATCNAAHYAKIVREMHRRRKLLGALWRGYEQLVEGNGDETLVDEVLEAIRQADVEAVHGGKLETSIDSVALTDVEPQTLQWLWPGRLPLGKITLLPGDPGLGKSLLSLDVAARVSTGTPWPDARHVENTAGSVLLLSGEDDLADTIRPRLDAAKADPAKIHAIDGITFAGDGERGQFNLQRDLPALEQTLADIGDVRLVVIDPISAFLGSGSKSFDSHRNSDVRGLLMPLAELAARRGVAVLAITHLNKGSGGQAIYRATGSLAFAAAARAVWLVAKDQQDPKRRLMLPAKMNLSPDPTGLAFRIADDATIAWESDPVTVTADEALSPAVDEDRRDLHDFLYESLAGGPMPSKQLEQEAKAGGFAVRTLRRAKKDIGVVSYREGFGAKGEWYCRLPEDKGGHDGHTQ